MSAQAEAEDEGPGSNETKFNNKVETIVNKAKSKAGDAGNPETDNVWGFNPRKRP